MLGATITVHVSPCMHAWNIPLQESTMCNMIVSTGTTCKGYIILHLILYHAMVPVDPECCSIRVSTGTMDMHASDCNHAHGTSQCMDISGTTCMRYDSIHWHVGVSTCTIILSISLGWIDHILHRCPNRVWPGWPYGCSLHTASPAVHSLPHRLDFHSVGPTLGKACPQ